MNALLSCALGLCLALALSTGADAAPDEERLGRDQGYPVGTAANWFVDERVRVGSFSHLDGISGILGGQVRWLRPGRRVLALQRAPQPPDYRWTSAQGQALDVDAYLERQRVTGLLILKDREILLERYQYQRGPEHRFVAHSMAKSLVSLAVGLALFEGRIASLDDEAQRYVPALADSVYGQTRLRNLLRMASGLGFRERYDGHDDLARFAARVRAVGQVVALKELGPRDVAQGERFQYASAETSVLAAVLQGATGQGLAHYLALHLWQPMGAEDEASWLTDREGLELGGGSFSATLRDYGRLGLLLAHDGRRPDTGEAVLPELYVNAATRWQHHPAPFQPGRAHPFWGYGYHFWIFPGATRRFALLGVFGQLIFVDPQLRLVMVQTAVDRLPQWGQTTLSDDALALWRAVLERHGGHW